MATISREELQAFMRRDFVSFVERSFYELNPRTEYLHNFHVEVIADVLEKCRTGKLRRLSINVPPRSLKSLMASVAFPAYLLGHNPAAQIICASYAQPLADKLAADCRSLMRAPWYQELFPGTLLDKESINEFTTTEKGFRLATSVGGVLTGRGADFIIIDDSLKPDEALSDVRRNNVNDWSDHTMMSRLNDKRHGCIIVIMQRLHEDDLVGHVLKQGPWTVIKFPAIAEQDEEYILQTAFGERKFTRRHGEALHPEREPLEVLAQLRESLGEYIFAGQYQQEPAPLGGGMVKTAWFKPYEPGELPEEFDSIFQSWDTANKTSELNDYSVCTTWGVSEHHLYLLDVRRERLDYPNLRRAVKEHALMFKAKNIVIEDKASGTQLIQDLQADGVHATTRYQTTGDKKMRMHSVTSVIESGFVHIPAQAEWLAQYLHEMAVFPNGKYDDQVDSTSQALDWFKNGIGEHPIFELYRQEAESLALNSTQLPEYTRAFPARVEWDDPFTLNDNQSRPPVTAACPKCGNRNLARCGVQGVSGDIEESCNCGWYQRIPRPPKIRAA